MITFPPGQDAIDPGFLDILMGAAKAYGQPLSATSGRQGRPTTPGSMHPHGRAVDLSMAGLDDAGRARLVETLRAQGARRFGTYTSQPNMLHVDMSEAQGGNWYMHDKTNRRLGQAPAWFRAVAGAPDVRQASATAGMSTDTDRTPTGDPRTGAMDRSPTMLPPFQLPQAQPQPQEQSPLLPLIALIAGTAMSKGGGMGRLMAGAGLAGTALRNADVAENELLDLQAKRADAMQRRQSKDAITRYAEMLQQDPKTADIGAMMLVNPAAGLDYYAKQRLEQQQMAQRQPLVEQLREMGDERGAVMAGLGYSPGAGPDTGGRQYGLTPQMYQTPEGKTMERVYAQDGSFVDREIPGTPTRYDPNVAGAVAQRQAAGKVKGTSEAQTEIELPKVLSDFDLTIGVVDSMLNHPGREWATGWQGNVPALGGTEQANYISKMEQLEGANFKEAFESLKGGGQITQVEGEKATKALTDLSRLQSDEEHRKSLETLRKVLADNRARALVKAGRPAPQEPVQAAPVEPPPAAAPGGWSIRKKE